MVLPFALSDTTGMALWSPNKRAGSANNQLNVSGNMAVQTYRIDDLVQQLNMPFPNHIKIDVDGIECLILSGGVKTLSDIRVKSLIVEVDERNEEQVDCVVDELKACGFGEPVTRHSPYFEKNYYLPSCNYLFTRK